MRVRRYVTWDGRSSSTARERGSVYVLGGEAGMA
jgi:hypothetical protein